MKFIRFFRLWLVIILLSSCSSQNDGDNSKKAENDLVINSFQDCEECPKMVILPKGRFLMGARPDYKYATASQLPQQEININYNLAVSVFEVTQAEYYHCIIAGYCENIYGISEKNHKANDFSFIDGNIFNKEWLEQIISSTINRNIPDLKIYPVRKSGNLKETLYVVQIPSSIEAPHMSREKRFYRRAQFESVIMEEYEIRQLYGRRVKSELFLRGFSIGLDESNDAEKFCFTCETGVVNEGEKLEKDYKINVYFSNIENTGLSFSWKKNGLGDNYHHTYMQNGGIKISAVGISTIYPNEVIDVLRLNFFLKKKNILDSLKKIKIVFRLYYPSGEDILETKMDTFLDEEKITNNHFE